MSPGWPAGAPIRRPTAAFSACVTRAGRSSSRSRFHAHENGVLLTFSRPLEREVADQAKRHFAQAWNYHYSASYGSPELSPRHPGQPGHDVLAISLGPCPGRRPEPVSRDPRPSARQSTASARQPRRRRTDRPVRDDPQAGGAVHRVPRLPPVAKTIAAHPILADMVALNHRPAPNPWRTQDPGCSRHHDRGRQEPELFRPIVQGAGRRADQAHVHESRLGAAQLGLDQARHAARVGDLVNKIIAEPDAASRHYIPARTTCWSTPTSSGRKTSSRSRSAPRPRRALSLSLHVPRPLDGHEWGDDRGLTLLAGDVLSKNRSNFRPQRGRHIRRPRTRHQIQPELGGGTT